MTTMSVNNKLCSSASILVAVAAVFMVAVLSGCNKAPAAGAQKQAAAPQNSWRGRTLTYPLPEGPVKLPDSWLDPAIQPPPGSMQSLRWGPFGDDASTSADGTMVLDFNTSYSMTGQPSHVDAVFFYNEALDWQGLQDFFDKSLPPDYELADRSDERSIWVDHKAHREVVVWMRSSDNSDFLLAINAEL